MLFAQFSVDALMSTADIDLALQNQVNSRNAWQEQEAAQQKAQRDEDFLLGVGSTQMTKEELRKIIDGDRRMYYRTEDLNDKLYIHYKGWRVMQNLEGWTGLKALYAENNAFDTIQGLQNCRCLRSLFLQDNCIQRMSGLDNCPDLWSINLSNNFICRIEGLSNLKRLNTLTIAKNKLGHGGVDDVIELVNSPVCSLDLQGNRLDDADIVPEVLMRMKDLRVLYLKDNPVTKKIVNYRKGITANCKDLTYLDDRPVFADDRRGAEAFNRGGIEEERAEKKKIRDEKVKQHERNMQAFQDMIDSVRREKREREEMRAEDKYTDETDPVESWERRAKRLNDAWKEDHADEIRDEPRERAEKMLRQEREQAAKKNPDGPMTSDDIGDMIASAEEDTDVPVLDNATPVDDKNDTDAAVDNRKLVYEDIWDDSPLATPSAPSKEDVAALEAQIKKLQEAHPGLHGVTAPSPSPEDIAKHSANLKAKAEQMRQEAEAGGLFDNDRPSWYSKYKEETGKVYSKLESSRLAFQAGGDAARPKPPSSELVSELPASDSDGINSGNGATGISSQRSAFRPPPRGQTELDEMD